MRIGMYSPYLPDHFGGGEKHFLTTAWYLSQNNQVEILIPSATTGIQKTIAKYQSLFDLDLSQILWRKSPLADRSSRAWQTWQETRGFDAFFYLTDGSLFLTGSPKSILHIQVPFRFSLSVIDRMKLKSWSVINTNSQFTRSVIEHNWRCQIPFVHYPYVDVSKIKVPGRKQKKIIAVGRFFDPATSKGQNKRQDLMIDAFLMGSQLHGWKKNGWELHLVGAIDPGEDNKRYVDELHKKGVRNNIFFHHFIPHAELAKLYQESSVFWHAAGYQVDELEHPELVEHFGMTTIEAMAHGCLPIVVDRGGLKETVDNGVNGWRFETVEGLIELTQQVMKMSKEEKLPLRQAARSTSEQFSLERFCSTIDQMLK